MDRAKVHHLRPIRSEVDWQPVPAEGRGDGMCGGNLPLDLAGEAPRQR